MKKLGLMNIKNMQKWILPAGIVALGVVSVVASGVGSKGSKATVNRSTVTSTQSQPAATPAAKVKPNISVNGKTVPTDKNGTTSVAIPGGTAQVNVSNGNTRVTTSENTTSGDTSNTQTGNVDVHIDSSSGGGTSQGSTQVFGFNSSLNGSDFSSSTFSSTNTGHVSITQP